MFLQMITYDSEYGDAMLFDDYKFTAESYEDLLASVLARFDLLLKERTLIIDRESGFTNVVETLSGKTAESYVVAYTSEQNLEEGVGGLLLADAIFYDPDSKEISCGFDADVFWDRFMDVEADVVEEWGLVDVKENQPPELDINKYGQGGGLDGLKLTEYLFNLCRSRLEAKS